MTTISRARDRAGKVLQKWGKNLERLNRQAFDRGGHQGHGGSRWQKRDTPRNWPILNRTGRLRRSIQWKQQGQQGDLITKVPYAKFHHFGTRYLPQRAIIEVTSQDIGRLKDALKKEIRQEYERGL